jgi:hypothetical protein
MLTKYIIFPFLKKIAKLQSLFNKIIYPICVNLYTVVHVNPEFKIYYFPYSVKYTRVALIEHGDSTYRYNLIFNFCPQEYVQSLSDVFFERLVFKHGKFVRYFDKIITTNTCRDNYKNILGEIMFIDRENVSFVFKRLLFSFTIKAYQLCTVLGKPKNCAILIITESFDEMTFKGSAYLN